MWMQCSQGKCGVGWFVGLRTFISPLPHQPCFKNSQNTPVLTFLLTCKKARQLSWQSNGLKIRVSVVQFHLWPPQFNQIYQYLTWFIGPLILCTKKVLQGSTSCILGYKPDTKFYIGSTKCLHPHHPYGVPTYFIILRERQSPEKISKLLV